MTRSSSSAVREIDMTPHAGQNDMRRRENAIDAQTTRHWLCDESTGAAPHRARLRMAQDDCRLRKVKLRGRTTVHAALRFASGAFNIKRIVTLCTATA
jgi:hypothetical protein